MHPRDQLLALLRDSGRPFEVLEHAYANTAEGVAEARGTPLAIGGKTLLLKVEQDFALFVLSGNRRTHTPKLRKPLGAQRLRFARTDELRALTGLVPGCIPPFGRPLFDLPLYVDAATAAQPEIAFSLAEHVRSVRMRTADYLALAQPTAVYDFSRED